MNESEFAALSARAQVFKLRTLALEVLKRYPLEVKRLRLLSHGFNTIFRVETVTGEKFALRINVNSHRTLPNIRAEIAWLEALRQETDLSLPIPIHAKDGSLVQVLEHAEAPKPLPSVLFAWLPGPNLDEKLSGKVIEQLGVTTAVLHQHALTYQLPADCELPSAAHVMYDSPRVLFEQESEWVPPARLEVFREAFELAQTAIDRAWAEQPARAIHSDLHQWNLKWFRGQLTVFDFDDCAMGQPVQDVVTSLYYLERQRPDTEFREALQRGYERVSPWPVRDGAQLEALLAARALLLANDVLSNLNPEIRKIAPGFMERTENNLRWLLEHGRFGVKPE